MLSKVTNNEILMCHTVIWGRGVSQKMIFEDTGGSVVLQKVIDDGAGMEKKVKD